MGRSSEDYKQQLAALAPPGLAWPVDESDAVMARLFHALADEAGRVDARGEVLIEEVDPRSSVELLLDWARVVGLPDPCSGWPPTTEGIRNAILERLTTPGGQSPQYFIDLAAKHGFTITIEEYEPFRVDDGHVDDLLNGDDVNFLWTVHAPEETSIPFRVDSSGVDESLDYFGNAELECLINRFKPAHTRVIFAYGS